MKPFTPEEKKKFDKIKSLVLGVVERMDNKKQLNIQRYKDLFAAFEKDPDSFRAWDVLHNDDYDSTIQIFQLPFEEMKLNQIKSAADFLGIELENYIYYRQDDSRGIRSKVKVPVGYVHVKRVQQILSKKNHYSFDNEDISLKTGQVKGESKNAAIAEAETYALSVIGAEKALEEFLGPRADNTEKKRQMYKDIARDGFVSLDNLKSSRTSSTTLNTINTYLLAAGIHTDLVNESLETEYTINKKLRSKN